MHLFKCISFYGALYTFRVSRVHVWVSMNDAADVLLQNKWVTFVVLLHKTSSFCLKYLIELLVPGRQNWGALAWTNCIDREWLAESSLKLLACAFCFCQQYYLQPLHLLETFTKFHDTLQHLLKTFLHFSGEG